MEHLFSNQPGNDLTSVAFDLPRGWNQRGADSDRIVGDPDRNAKFNRPNRIQIARFTELFPSLDFALHGSSFVHVSRYQRVTEAAKELRESAPHPCHHAIEPGGVDGDD